MHIRKVGKLNAHLTPRRSARVRDKVPSPSRRSRGAQLDRYTKSPFGFERGMETGPETGKEALNELAI